MAYDYLSAEPQPSPSLPQLGTEMAASFVPGLNIAQALRDYMRAVKEKDYLGMGLSAAGTVPGIGAASKAMLLLPGLLRKSKSEIKALNETLIPQHSTFINSFSSKTPQHLESPSFSLQNREFMSGFGNDIVDPLEMLKPGDLDYVPMRDLMLIGKPNALDPKHKVGSIYSHDAMTASQEGKYMSLQDRQALNEEMISDWNRYNPKDKTSRSYAEYLRKATSNNPEMASPGMAELKLYQNLPLNSENFSGALMDERTFSKALSKVLKARGIKTESVDLLGDKALVWDKANWLQRQSIK
jgi:hypothetical protein